MSEFQPVDLDANDDALDLLIESFHTALRKAYTESPEVSEIWHLLHKVSRRDKLSVMYTTLAFLKADGYELYGEVK